jgi:hypothetical protein
LGGRHAARGDSGRADPDTGRILRRRFIVRDGVFIDDDTFGFQAILRFAAGFLTTGFVTVGFFTGVVAFFGAVTAGLAGAGVFVAAKAGTPELVINTDIITNERVILGNFIYLV